MPHFFTFRSQHFQTFSLIKLENINQAKQSATLAKTTAPHLACDFNDTTFSLRRQIKMPGSTYARVQRYEITPWQRARAESIIHTGANKGNNVRRATVCNPPPTPMTGPPTPCVSTMQQHPCLRADNLLSSPCHMPPRRPPPLLCCPCGSKEEEKMD